jgi:hypothetical protein
MTRLEFTLRAVAILAIVLALVALALSKRPDCASGHVDPVTGQCWKAP